MASYGRQFTSSYPPTALADTWNCNAAFRHANELAMMPLFSQLHEAIRIKHKVVLATIFSGKPELIGYPL